MQYNIHLPYYNETFLYGYGFQIRYKLPSKRNNKYEENTDTFNRDGKLCCFLGGSDRF